MARLQRLYRRHLKPFLPKRYYAALVRQAVWWRYVLTRSRYAGDGVECPFCAGTFKRFLPYSSSKYGLADQASREKRVVGGSFSPDSTCPRCHSSERERALYLYLRDETDLFSGRKIRLLHIAPEPDLERLFRAQGSIDYVSGDLVSPAAEFEIDVMNVPFPEATFDVILCNHVLEHVDDDRKAMRELHRVLKPGGWAILQVPISLALEATQEDPSLVSPEDRERLFCQFDHVRLYARDYVDRLRGAGFRVEPRAYAKELGAGACRRFGLLADEEIFHCSKPLAGPRPRVTSPP